MPILTGAFFNVSFYFICLVGMIFIKKGNLAILGFRQNSVSYVVFNLIVWMGGWVARWVAGSAENKANSA